MLRLACCATAAAASAAALFAPASTELAARSSLYLEDAPAPRPIAAVQARVVQDADGVRLELTVSPRGEGVEAVPGLDGLPGVNLRTAEELDRLWREDSLRLIVRDAGRSIDGELPVVTWSPLPVRLLANDGRFAASTTRVPWPVAVQLRSAALPDGSSHCYLEAGGVPRLFVHVVRDGDGARIDAIESVAEAVTAPAAPPRAAAAVQDPASRVVFPGDWAKRDLEGKWVAYRSAFDAAKDTKNLAVLWAEALGARRELELLEWIAVFEGSGPALAQLEKLDAPQWIRAAVWNAGNADSHGQDAAAKALLRHAARVRGWFEQNAPLDAPAARALRVRIEAAAERGQPVATDLPALDPMQLLVPWLDAPAQLEEFGARRTAEPKVRYVHQVLRAIGGVPVSGVTDDRVVTKLVRLTQHDHAAVPRVAFDALAKLSPGAVPLDAMLRIADDATARAESRRLAVVVLSASSHPRAQQELVRIALDEGHAAKGTAVQRLREVGDPIGAAAVPAAAAAIERRKRERVFGQPVAARLLLQRVAYLRTTGAPDAEEVARATAALLRESIPASEMAAHLDAVAAMPAPPSPFRGDEAERVERALAAFLDELRRVRDAAVK